MRYRAMLGLGALAAASLGCSGADDPVEVEPPSAEAARDSRPDGLYKDFLDGKYDSAGHPLDAQVWEAESECGAEAGQNEKEGRAFRPSGGADAVACRGTSKPVGKGRFVLSLRALALEPCTGDACELPALTVNVKKADGTLLESKSFARGAFVTPLTQANLALAFTHPDDGSVDFEVVWHAEVAVRLDYAELFRSTRNLLVAPPSGVLAPDAKLSVEALDPPPGFALEVKCDDIDLGSALAALLASGEATREDTEFRALYTIPTAKLLEGCKASTRVRFSVVVGSWAQETARVSVYPEEAPCTFPSGTSTRVLLTGFEPFPASSTHDNSSEQAVAAFDPGVLQDVSVMKLTLPVEFDTAAAIVASAIERCKPDVVIGFGQGRSEVDLETTAYNLQDSSEIAGGVPDNRGKIPGGTPIVAGGPAELTTGLPGKSIRDALTGAGIAAGFSDDPGRYVCNNVFYGMMTAASGTPRVSGFVHLPYIHTVDDADRAMLKTVVTEVVRAAVKKRRGEL